MTTSKQILTESVWQVLTEDTQNYLREWDTLIPLIESAILTEQDLTPQQIQQLFTDAEAYAIDSGKFKTGLGKAGSAAAAAGQAVAGGVKLASNVVNQINNKINDLGKAIQDTTPVKGIDAAFEKAKKDLYNKLGGQDSKVNQAITKMGQLAKDHPGKTKFLVGALTTAAAMAGGPAGGAAAGFVLRAASDLLKGEKLSTAVGKSAKTAALGFLAGKAFDWMSSEIKEWFSEQSAEDLANTVKQMQDADVTAAVDSAREQYGEAADLLQNSSVKDAIVYSPNHTSILNGQVFRFSADEVLMTPNQLSNFEKLIDQADSVKALIQRGEQFVPNPDYISKMGKAYQYLKDVTEAPDYLENYKVLVNGKQAMSAIKQAGEDALNNPALKDVIAKLTGDAANDVAVMKQIADTAAAVGQGTATSATMRDKKKESIDYESVRMKHLAGLTLTESEQRVLDEGPLDAIKKGAATAASAVGKVAGKAGAAIAKGAKAAGKELGQKITSRKLNSLWKQAGSPTDAASVASILSQAGLDRDGISAISQKSNVKLPAPAPAQRQTAQPAGQPQQRQTTTAAPSATTAPTAQQGSQSVQGQSSTQGAQGDLEQQPADQKKPGAVSRIGKAVSGMAKGAASAIGRAAQAAMSGGDDQAAPTPAGGQAAPTSAGGQAAPTSAGGQAAPTSAGGQAAPTPAGGQAAPAGKKPAANKQSMQNINNYVKNVASQINQAQGPQKIALAKEIVNFMADRKGTPEWDNAAGTVKAVLKKAGLNPNVANAAMQKLAAGQTMESFQYWFIKTLLKETNLTFADLGLTEKTELHENKKVFVIEDNDLNRIKKLAGL